MKIKSAIPADQLPAIIETVKATELAGHKKYLMEIGLDEAAATTFATAIAEIVASMYSEELGETEPAEPAAEPVTVSDTPEEARNFAGKVAKAYKEIKAGSTFSAATKSKLAALMESGNSHLKALKALHDEAHASKEESAPEAGVKEISLADYLQTKGN
jgi:hypothetical protein